MKTYLVDGHENFCSTFIQLSTITKSCFKIKFKILKYIIKGNFVTNIIKYEFINIMFLESCTQGILQPELALSCHKILILIYKNNS